MTADRAGRSISGGASAAATSTRRAEIAAEQGRPDEETRRELLASVPLQRISEPEDVAGQVGFLCSPNPAAVTGHAFDPSDGAWLG